jgi:hypothetical protein
MVAIVVGDAFSTHPVAIQFHQSERRLRRKLGAIRPMTMPPNNTPAPTMNQF